MTIHFDHLLATRHNYLSAIEGLSLDQLNVVPEGFSNSIAWNLAHALVTQQLLMYGLSGNTFRIDPRWVERYRKGTRADEPMPAATLAEVKRSMIHTVDLARQDLADGMFVQYQPYTTSFGVQLRSIEDAIRFNNIHEGLHLGYLMAMKHLV